MSLQSCKCVALFPAIVVVLAAAEASFACNAAFGYTGSDASQIDYLTGFDNPLKKYRVRSG